MVIQLGPGNGGTDIAGLGIHYMAHQFGCLVCNGFQSCKLCGQIHSLQLAFRLAGIDLSQGCVIMGLCQFPVFLGVGGLTVNSQGFQLRCLHLSKLSLCQFLIESGLIFTLGGTADGFHQDGIARRIGVQTVREQGGIGGQRIGRIGAEGILGLCVVDPVIRSCQIPHQGIGLRNLSGNGGAAGTMVHGSDDHFKFGHQCLDLQQGLLHGGNHSLGRCTAGQIVDADHENAQFGLIGGQLLGELFPLGGHRAAQAHIIDIGILGEEACVVIPHFRIGVTEDQHLGSPGLGACRQLSIAEGNPLCTGPQTNAVAPKGAFFMDRKAVDLGVMRIVDIAMDDAILHYDLHTVILFPAVGRIEAGIHYGFHTVCDLYQFHLAAVAQTEQIVAAAVLAGTEHDTGRSGIIGGVDLGKVGAVGKASGFVECQSSGCGGGDHTVFGGNAAADRFIVPGNSGIKVYGGLPRYDVVSRILRIGQPQFHSDRCAGVLCQGIHRATAEACSLGDKRHVGHGLTHKGLQKGNIGLSGFHSNGGPAGICVVTCQEQALPCFFVHGHIEVRNPVAVGVVRQGLRGILGGELSRTGQSQVGILSAHYRHGFIHHQQAFHSRLGLQAPQNVLHFPAGHGRILQDHPGGSPQLHIGVFFVFFVDPLHHGTHGVAVLRACDRGAVSQGDIHRCVNGRFAVVKIILKSTLARKKLVIRS